jgi:regulator of replication initiation timing
MQSSKLRDKINLMKTLRSLLGLALLSAGLYLSYVAFTSLNDLENLNLALYLGAAFVLMTLGLYFFLLTFLGKKEVHSFKESLEEALDITDQSETQEHIEKIEENLVEDQVQIETLKETVSMIEETMVLNLFDEKPSIKEEETSVPEPTLEETTIQLDHPSEEKDEEILEEYDEESTQTLKNFFGEENKDPEDEVYSTQSMDARLIGIETWNFQNRLKKIPEGSECTLQINTKQGLRSAEIYYEKTLIGYLSKVDYNKMEEKLPKLYTIKLVTKILENKKVVTALLRFSFKD